MTNQLSEYGFSFQVKVLAAMFTDRTFLQQIADIIQPEYFESESNSWILDIILGHFRTYKTPPTKDVLKVKVTEIEHDVLKVAVVEQLKEVFRYMESDDLSFVKDEILRFCKNQEIKHAIMDSVNLLKIGNYDEIKTKIDSAMKAGADTDIGHEYKSQVALRYNEAARHTITTGWDVVDDLMDGGLAPGELGVVMAPAGIGKCIGPNTKVEIEYDEIGIPLKSSCTGNDIIIWVAPWEKFNVGGETVLYGWEIELILNNPDSVSVIGK